MSEEVHMLIAMAGLPGTGKSTLAVRVATALGGVILSKDIVRSALFPVPVLDYSSAQDDLAMSAVFAAAKYILSTDENRIVIIDGRTFRLSAQVAELFALGSELKQVPKILECICEPAIARVRLDRDAATGEHPAGNRTAALHAAVSATAEPLAVTRLTLDTGCLSIDECLACALDYLRQS
jgi:hypothetical protein